MEPCCPLLVEKKQLKYLTDSEFISLFLTDIVTTNCKVLNVFVAVTGSIITDLCGTDTT